MITVQEAERIILSSAKVFPVVAMPLEKCYGLVLRETIKADRDQPPFHKALMDGIAVNYDTWQRGVHRFTIQGIQPAGQKMTSLKSGHYCVEIMTGAVVPQGADCVVPVEKNVVADGTATVNDGVKIERLQNIRLQGSDRKRGEVLLTPSCVLKPAAIGVLASVGKNRVKVTRKPDIAIISTGDELVDIAAPIRQFQTRRSNSYALQAILEKTHLCSTKLFHLRDDAKQMRWLLRSILGKFDILILSGGVSMGKFDLVPQVLNELGVKLLFHKVQQKPGKPFWFGQYKEGKAVFALPGNPVSTQICAYRYVLPYLRKAVGLDTESGEWGVLEENVHIETDLTYFLPVTIRLNEQAQIFVKPVSILGSGDFVALAHSAGFVELPSERYEFLMGSKVKLFRW